MTNKFPMGDTLNLTSGDKRQRGGDTRFRLVEFLFPLISVAEERGGSFGMREFADRASELDIVVINHHPAARQYVYRLLWNVSIHKSIWHLIDANGIISDSERNTCHIAVISTRCIHYDSHLYENSCSGILCGIAICAQVCLSVFGGWQTENSGFYTFNMNKSVGLRWFLVLCGTGDFYNGLLMSFRALCCWLVRSFGTIIDLANC